MKPTWHVSVKDNKQLKSGHRARFWCSQDEDHKKKSKGSDNPDTKNRDNVGMKRYPCKSRLTITCRETKTGSSHITMKLHHHAKHVHYVDVAMPPEALQMIQDHLEWLTPAAMTTKIQLAYPAVTSTQIHTAWRELSKVHWFRDPLQLPSATKLWPSTAMTLIYLLQWMCLRGSKFWLGG